ncbi:hypothetical protein KNJ79_16010 [Sphingopyxis indica]|uniref:hypothetical protein n=1 Tax=Sphingopyxis indica TaxID=436663 RepID=UPI0029394234|nr:hypothetical protein [Sphingopyxis indica]WOF42655.1 hypothetical protein KNJ79_16010 [Sphingopyxis indica]
MTLIELASLFEERKLWIVTASGLDKDALHIYFGMALFLAVRLVWRGPRGWLVAWLAVVAMACGGEWLDLTVEARHAAIQPDAAHWHDIWNTCFWPTVILLLSRWLQPARREVPALTSGEGAERRFEQA